MSERLVSLRDSEFVAGKLLALEGLIRTISTTQPGDPYVIANKAHSYSARVDSRPTWFGTWGDYLVFHTPFAGVPGILEGGDLRVADLLPPDPEMAAQGTTAVPFISPVNGEVFNIVPVTPSLPDARP